MHTQVSGLTVILWFGGMIVLSLLYSAYSERQQSAPSNSVNCTTDSCYEYYDQKLYEQGQDNARPDYIDAQGL